MKNIFKRLIILCFCCLGLVGCGKTKTNLNVEEATKIADKKLKDMYVVDDSMLDNVYKLDFDLLTSYVVKQNESGDLYMILETDKKSEVKKNVKEFFENVKSFNESYSKDRLKIIDNRLEEEVGNYLIYIAAKDAEDIYKEIEKGMK